jgi:hypothetical protein
MAWSVMLEVAAPYGEPDLTVDGQKFDRLAHLLAPSGAAFEIAQDGRGSEVTTMLVGSRQRLRALRQLKLFPKPVVILAAVPCGFGRPWRRSLPVGSAIPGDLAYQMSCEPWMMTR